jgi:hypothetical protein
LLEEEEGEEEEEEAYTAPAARQGAVLVVSLAQKRRVFEGGSLQCHTMLAKDAV